MPGRAAPRARSIQRVTSSALARPRREGLVVGVARQHHVHRGKLAADGGGEGLVVLDLVGARLVPASCVARSSTARLNLFSVQVQPSPWLRMKAWATASE